MNYYGDYLGFENYGSEKDYFDEKPKSNRNYYNNNSKNTSLKKNFPLITMEDALIKSSYPKYLQDFIKEFIINNYSNNKNKKVYLTLVNNESLFVIEYKLSVYLNGKSYEIFILVYLPKLYPNYEPNFYILKDKKFSVSDYYKNGKINEKTLKINLYSFIPFDPAKNNIEEIINKINEEFNKEFPIYKSENNEILSEECVLNKDYTKEIIIENKNNNFNFNYEDINKFNDIQINDNNNNKNKDFDDESLLLFMRTQVKDVLREKYFNFNEKFKIKNIYNDLKEVDNTSKIELNNINKLYTEENYMKQELKKLQKIKEYLNSVENKLIEEKNNILNSKNKSIFDKCDELIKIKDNKDFEYIIMQKTIEDYLVYLKKAYEKKIVSFEDMVNTTRQLSRELFYITYIRNKSKYFK